jgi:hypothetical protein
METESLDVYRNELKSELRRISEEIERRNRLDGT